MTTPTQKQMGTTLAIVLPLDQRHSYAGCTFRRRVGSGMKALSCACGCAGRIFALSAQKDITPRGDALWKQQRSMRLISISLSSIKGLTKSVRVLRLVQKDGSVPICGQSVFMSLRLPPILVTICGRTADLPRVSMRRVIFGRGPMTSMNSLSVKLGAMGLYPSFVCLSSVKALQSGEP